ncbi:MAG: ketoacyl-ACP synthase III [candidate division KSB1 bacterium]|nr:ketoacyl-ACP synthase III [candidate division KSB1 bacterium]MDZ7337157.1 ketoacyl-ACP synthase III [candidate division KSB1 bacterium]MDZ7378190.1 ketoacyl-ACP synthase III [candidate division KSB1 bacterium]MDZ7385461.1 ketoacyl-ACP synthase III [candidate division KSB1 bacterium]MDZ7391808.1 ketoacyl-ACP synthase III [candidate division KSB1 bacterium]
MNRLSRIAGTGICVPERVVTNFDLEKLMDTSDQWIRERTGIAERRFVEPGVGSSDLALGASLMALENAGKRPEDVDFIIFATLSPEYPFPGSGCLLQAKLGINDIGALDVRNQCSGFIYGLSVADQYVRTGMYRCVLVVGAEVQSIGLNLSTAGRDTAVLFGDGAGAVVLTPSDGESGVLSTHLHADGRYAKELWMEHPGCLRRPRLTPEMLTDGSMDPKMNGRAVFKHAVVRFCEAIEEALRANHLDIEQVSLIIPHQANLRITEAVAERFGGMEKVYSNIHKYGNTTAASIPIALHEAVCEGRIRPGDYVVLVAFGSGFTWASAVVRW